MALIDAARTPATNRRSADQSDRAAGANDYKGDDGNRGKDGDDGRSAVAAVIRAGQVVVATNGRVFVRFRKPLNSDRYVIALTPGRKTPPGWRLHWERKMAGGFTVAAQSDSKQGTQIPIDWVVTVISN